MKTLLSRAWEWLAAAGVLILGVWYLLRQRDKLEQAEARQRAAEGSLEIERETAHKIQLEQERAEVEHKELDRKSEDLDRLQGQELADALNGEFL